MFGLDILKWQMGDKNVRLVKFIRNKKATKK